MENISDNRSTDAYTLLFLRTPDGEEYGPADLNTIREWCAEGRIGPDQLISTDQQVWTPVTEIPELQFDWLLVLKDGTEAGPFHLAMLEEQAQVGNLPEESIIRNRYTKKEHSTSQRNSFADEEMPHSQADEDLSTQEPLEPHAAPATRDDQETETAVSEPDEEMDMPSSLRLETISQHAAEAREQLTQTRATLQALRQEHTLLQDQHQHLQDRLTTTEMERDDAEKNLLAQQNISAQNETELDNLRGQLAQMQEHYEKLQLENQRQFEQIDDLRAAALTTEQSWERELAVIKSKLEDKNRILKEVSAALAQDNSIISQAAHQTAPEEPQRIETTPPTHSPSRNKKPSPSPLTTNAPPLPSIDTPSPLTFTTLNRSLIAGIIIFLLTFAGWGILSILIQNTANRQPQEDVQMPPDELESFATAKPELDDTLVLQPEQIHSHAERTHTNTVQNWPTINLSRAAITKDNSAMQITFDYGLFPSGTRLRPEAREDLQKLAEQMRNQIDDFSIIVEGHTDTIPVHPDNERFIDNFSLGMARAEAVKDLLTEIGNLPAGRIHTASAGQSSPPYPNDTMENRARNRTVTISIIP